MPSIRSTFPSADKSWVYDLSNDQWNEYSSIDINGVHHRLNGFLSAYAYNTNVMIDWKTGDLYSFDPDTFTDNTMPVVCTRGFPHSGQRQRDFLSRLHGRHGRWRSAEYAAWTMTDRCRQPVLVRV
jgi:hypothetical protein